MKASATSTCCANESGLPAGETAHSKSWNLWAKAHAEYLEEEWFAGRLLPLWLTTHGIERRRLEAMHVDYPRLLSRDFARRDGLVNPAPIHRLAARILMGLLVDATTPAVLDRSIPYAAQLDLVLKDWKRESQQWLGAG